MNIQIEGTDWTKYEGEEFPAEASKFAKDNDIFQWHGRWTEIFFKGKSMKKAIDWIIVTDDGGSYKVGATWMLWNKDYVKAAWSRKALIDMIMCIIKDKEMIEDPNYQT